MYGSVREAAGNGGPYRDRIYSLITPSLDGRGAGVWIQDQV
jgi:hypothetical protein